MLSITDQVLTAGSSWNEHEGKRPKILFACSGGFLRSPTAAALATELGINARSCGTRVEDALIPISAALVTWAHLIVFMGDANYRDAVKVFQGSLDPAWQRKAVIANVPDFFDYMEDDLVGLLRLVVFPEITRLPKYFSGGPLTFSN